MKKSGNQRGREMLKEERVGGGYFVDLIAEQLRQSFLCVCVCVDSPISPNQTLAAVFHLSLSAPELRGEEQGEPWTFGPGWSSNPGPGPRCGTQVYSPGLLISSKSRERNGRQS